MLDVARAGSMSNCSGSNFPALKFRANPSLIPEDSFLDMHLKIENVSIEDLDAEGLSHYDEFGNFTKEYEAMLNKQHAEGIIKYT